MNKSSLGIFLDQDTEDPNLDLYKVFFKDTYDDIVIISDSIMNTKPNWAMVSSYYLRFFPGAILFTDIGSYMAHKDMLLSKDIYLYSSPQDLLSNNVSLNMLKNTKLVTINNNTIEIKNYEKLRPTL